MVPHPASECCCKEQLAYVCRLCVTSETLYIKLYIRDKFTLFSFNKQKRTAKKTETEYWQTLLSSCFLINFSCYYTIKLSTLQHSNLRGHDQSFTLYRFSISKFLTARPTLNQTVSDQPGTHLYCPSLCWNIRYYLHHPSRPQAKRAQQVTGQS